MKEIIKKIERKMNDNRKKKREKHENRKKNDIKRKSANFFFAKKSFFRLKVNLGRLDLLLLSPKMIK